MTDATVNIAADEKSDNRDGSAWYSDLEHVSVSLAGEARCNGDEEAGAEYRCARCRRSLYEGEPGVFLVVGEAQEHACEASGGDEDGHSPVPVPLSWANSASITLDEEGDRISVAISVGDPRGAFTMAVERVRYTRCLLCGEEPPGGNGAELCPHEWRDSDELRLAAPHPGQTAPHMALTPLASPGYYRIEEQ